VIATELPHRSTFCAAVRVFVHKRKFFQSRSVAASACVQKLRVPQSVAWSGSGLGRTLKNRTGT
jgi:hypothetical protein